MNKTILALDVFDFKKAEKLVKDLSPYIDIFKIGPIVEIMDSVQSNRLTMRHEEWINSLNDRLKKIEYKVEELGNSEFFTSSLIKATEIAAKTQEKEKRDYLVDIPVR